jgi:isopentenyldiphosphate isomerase
MQKIAEAPGSADLPAPEEAASACWISCAPTTCKTKATTPWTLTSPWATRQTSATISCCSHPWRPGGAFDPLADQQPWKIKRLAELGVSVTERVALETTVYADNAQYLITKAFRMNHLLDLGEFPLEVPAHKNGNH